MSSNSVAAEGGLDETMQLVRAASADTSYQTSILSSLADEIAEISIERPLSLDERFKFEALATSAERFAESVKQRLDDAELALIGCRKALDAEVES